MSIHVLDKDLPSILSGQIEWYNNFVDDKSTQVGGKQVIITYDDYLIPLVSREELMYLEFIGKLRLSPAEPHFPILFLFSSNQITLFF